MKGMKTQRSNTATRLRRHCATLFGVSESDMLRAEIRKEKFRARIGWIDDGPVPGLHGSYSSIDVEILHTNFSGLYDIKTIFLNPILMWVSHSLLIHYPGNDLITDRWSSGLCCHYSWSDSSQGAYERYSVKSENGDHGAEAWHPAHNTRGHRRCCCIGIMGCILTEDFLTKFP